MEFDWGLSRWPKWIKIGQILRLYTYYFSKYLINRYRMENEKCLQWANIGPLIRL